MFTRMVPVKKETHIARDVLYELLVFQVQETQEYRIYIVKDGFGVGDIFTASQEVVQDAATATGVNVVQSLIDIAKDDIDRNQFDRY